MVASIYFNFVVVFNSLFLFVHAVRLAIFGSLWIILGKRVWFFPNILAEEVTLRELFQFWPKKDEEDRPKWTARLFFAVLSVLFILLLRHHAPDEAARARQVSYICNMETGSCYDLRSIYLPNVIHDIKSRSPGIDYHNHLQCTCLK